MAVTQKPHTRRPTLRDVAQALNLSVTAVSKVINDHDDISAETKSEVWAKIRELGYTPNFMASNLRRKQGNIVGLIVSDISQPFFSEVIRGYETTLNAAGYQTLILTSFESPDRELDLLRQTAALNPAGLIIDIAQRPERSIEFLRSLDIPFVLSNRYVNKQQDYFVVADNVEAGYQATRHLLSRRPNAPVLCINGPDAISPTTDRFFGYQKAMREAGETKLDDWVFNNHYGLQDGWHTCMEICRRIKPPFSVFCSTDIIALGFIRAALEQGYDVPGDISVIGVDDIDLASYTRPALTTMSLPKELMGRKSAQKLITLMEHGQVRTPREFIQPELKIREST